MRSGSGAPSNSVGNEGDLYHRTDVPSIYGPKSGGVWPATYSAIVGPGCTTAWHIDWDCDGYGVSPNGAYAAFDPNPLFGPDADDNDATVNTTATALAKYSTIDGWLAAARDGHAGYTGILRYWAISTTGAPTCSAGTSTAALAAPCNNWEYIHQHFQAGDAVIWRGGTYSFTASFEWPTVTATQTHPVLLVAYPGEKPIIDYTGRAYGLANPDGGMNWITWDGLALSSNDVNGLAVNMGGGSNPTNNLTFRNMDVKGAHGGFWMMQDLHDILIERNVLHDTNYSENLYLGARDKPNSNLTVQNNIIFHSGFWAPSGTSAPAYGDGYPGTQHNGRVTNAIYQGNISHSNGGAGFSWESGVSHSYMFNNLSFNNARACLTIYNYNDGQADINPYDQNYNTFENNTCVVGQYDAWGGSTAGVAGYVINNDSNKCGTNFCGDLGHNTWRNNIIQTYRAPAWYFYNDDVLASVGIAPYSSTSTFTNNLINRLDSGTDAVWMGGQCSTGAGETQGVAPCNAGGTGPFRPLLTYTLAQFATMAGSASANSQADPKFAAYSTAYYSSLGKFDFHLQSGSPAIAAGSATGTPSTDITGATRANPPSIGAYENAR